MAEVRKERVNENIALYKKNRRTIIYIAGPITNNRDYKAKFAAAEKTLTEQGYGVFNPSVFPAGMEYESYIRICKAAVGEVDAVYMLAGWKDSEGANIEHNHARVLGKEIKYQNPEEIA